MVRSRFTFFLSVFFIFAMAQVSCKKDDIFVDPAYVFLKWSYAVKSLNYGSYSTCEAFPKSDDVFRELYSNYYYDDLVTRDLGTYKEKDVRTDLYGKKYNYRTVYFECRRVERKSGRTVESMKGEVEFIQYTDKPDSDRGWLMYNRTIIRSGAENLQ